MKDDGDGWGDLIADMLMPVIGFIILIIGVICAISVFTSCATYEAIVMAPPEFWATGETIIMALLQDIYDLIDLLL